MAEFLVAAEDLQTEYVRGDLITVREDGWRWGIGERLPQFWIVKVPAVTLEQGQAVLNELWEDAQSGDREFDAPDAADRRIKRHRRDVRLDTLLLPVPIRNELTFPGVTTLTAGQAQAAYRHLVYNRGNGQVEDDGEALP